MNFMKFKRFIKFFLPFVVALPAVILFVGCAPTIEPPIQNQRTTSSYVKSAETSPVTNNTINPAA